MMLRKLRTGQSGFNRLYVLLITTKTAGFYLLMAALLPACNALKDTPKYGFTEGYYRSRLYHKKMKRVYLSMSTDTVKVYTVKKLERNSVIDSVNDLKLAFGPTTPPLHFENYRFGSRSFDLDVLSVLFKYRPAISNFPRQFNTFLNGALYAGYRVDHYLLSYKKTPFGADKRSITHYGFSTGIFSGVGMAHIDPSLTRNAIDYEYDGIVNLSGLAVIVAMDKLSFGLTAGVDHLLDGNHKVWINNGKFWTGLSVGLNLN